MLGQAKYPNSTDVIIVNVFWQSKQTPRPYYKDPLVGAFLRHKRIHLVCNPHCETKHVLPFLIKYKIWRRYQIGYKGDLKERKTKRYFSHFPYEWYQTWAPLKERFSLVGSLGAAIVYAVVVLDRTEIDIFGLDFYERDYYLRNSHEYQNELENSAAIKVVWKEFLKQFPSVKFNIYTNAEFSR